MTVESRFSLELPYAPRSLNRNYKKNPFAYQRIKANLQRDLETALLVAAVPRGLGSVVATAVLRFPVKRSRDEGNFRWLLEKALGDALTNGGWLSDDTPDQFRFQELAFDVERGTSRTLIEIRCC